MDTLFLALPGNETMARSLAGLLDSETGDLELRRFPDGETYVRIADDVAGRSVILVCTLDRPDGKLLPILFTADAARELGASDVGIVCPYLAYMRQDMRFEPGEAVTSASFARLLPSWLDWIVTVDPHLHRLSSLASVYKMPAAAVHAAPLVADWIREHIDCPLIVGPDSESAQWVAGVAEKAQAPYVVLEKVRRGDRDVEISMPEIGRWRHHTPVLVDDIVSTATTMVETLNHLRSAGLAPPVCIAVHAVLAGDAESALRGAGAADVVTCNTIAHPTNRIDVSAAISVALRKQLGGSGNASLEDT
jgi:ribose-phosphate pyrophosphokinase